ncbi:MAG: hypothetical protein RLZZ233_1111 [Verrucomicrobiota bacterium]|jgi:hypothetical protein
MRSLLLILAAGILAACDKPESAGHSAGPTPKAAEFKQGQGILLTDEASKFIGLRFGEAHVMGDVVRIPLSAVVDTSEGKHVFVRNGQRWLRTAVKLGVVSGEVVDVADGLLEGDVIAVDGGRYLWLAELQAIKGGVGCADGH